MIKSRKYNNTPAALSDSIEIKVRFSEVDSLKIVWHGVYVKYFEDGREAFGNTYTGLGYLDICNSGFTAPIVDINIQYLRPLSIGETAVVETRYYLTDAAVIYFEYGIKNSEGELVARGSTTQAFLDGNGNLCLQDPEFYTEWKKRWLKK